MNAIEGQSGREGICSMETEEMEIETQPTSTGECMNTTETPKWIYIDQLQYAETQTRAALREDAIEDYTQLIREGKDLGPAVVYREESSGRYFQATGNHRREAYRRAGQDKMPCVVRRGTKWDAIEAGIKDNQQHKGVRPSREDREHNIKIVLREQPKKSDRWISELVGCDHKTVNRIRQELVSTGEIPSCDEREGIDGRVRGVRRAAFDDCRPEGTAQVGASDGISEQQDIPAGDNLESHSNNELAPSASIDDTSPSSADCTDGSAPLTALPRRSVKSVEELFEQSYRALGKLQSYLHEINEHLMETQPNPRRHGYFQAAISKLGDQVTEWRKENGVKSKRDVPEKRELELVDQPPF
jgi:hypothetical protein